MKDDYNENNIVIEINNTDSDSDSVPENPSSLSASINNYTDGIQKLSTSLAEFAYRSIRLEDTVVEQLSKVIVKASQSVMKYSGLADAMMTSFSVMSKKIIESAAKVTQSFSPSAIASPLLDALRNISIDYSGILKQLSELSYLSDKFNVLKEAHMQALYEAKWFPFMMVFTNLNVLTEINEIINTTRTGSRNREKKIDKALLSFFTENELKNIKSEMWNMELPHWQRRAISQAINAHFRKEYILTISCLAPMWEQLFSQRLSIRKIPKDKNNEKYKSNIKELFSENGFNAVLADFYNQMIISQCNSVDDIKEGIPNRHGIAHGWYKKYPNKKASLNAILLTYFILKLEPINQTEENENG